MIFGKRRDRDLDYADYYDDGEDRSRERPQRPRRKKIGFLPHIAILISILAILLVAIWLVAGRIMFEKTLQSILSPVGFVWIGLFLVFYLSALHRARGPCLISLFVWLILTIAGNSVVSNRLVQSLESKYPQSAIAEYPSFDVVLVHGGGVGTSPNKSPQLRRSGDRLLMAARLFKSGKVKKIVCSGTYGLPPYAGELSQAEAMANILTELGVPQENIAQIDGANTLQEAQAFDRWLDRENQLGENDSSISRADMKIGIITSAWHMPRAMRLSESVGIKATAIPCDFIGKPFSRDPGLIVPFADNLHTTHLVVKEILASMVGR